SLDYKTFRSSTFLESLKTSPKAGFVVSGLSYNLSICSVKNLFKKFDPQNLDKTSSPGPVPGTTRARAAC
ncbi:hypothetical protein ACNA6A_27095, partial [Klebsiella pneumoniae]